MCLRYAFAATRTDSFRQLFQATIAKGPSRVNSIGFQKRSEMITADDVKARAKAAILGSFVADAACCGMHWVYDVSKMDENLAASSKTDTPEFFEPSANPFYQHPNGALSVYGDENLVLLQSVAKHGELDPVAFTQDQVDFYKAYPSYLNKVNKGLVANVEAGAKFPNAAIEDQEVHCLVKAPVVVALYAGSPLLKEKMRDAILTSQNSPTAVSLGVAGALILEQVILGSSIQEALEFWAQQPGNLDESALGHIKEVFEAKDVPHRDAVGSFGRSCNLPGSFKSPLHNVAAATSYVEGVRKTILAGGDNCGRVGFTGALLAAGFGMDGVPQEWREKTTKYAELEGMAEKVVSLRAA